MPSIETSKQLLIAHHRELANTCQALMSTAYADDKLQLIAEFRRFEAAIREHLDVEEAELLDDYAKFDPDDARSLLEEHERFRKLLLQLAVDAELHAIRAEHVENFIARLEAHAHHEERGLYAWAERHVSADANRRLAQRIGHSLQQLLGRPRAAAAGTIDPMRFSV